jgi:hypothetical protein
VTANQHLAKYPIGVVVTFLQRGGEIDFEVAHQRSESLEETGIDGLQAPRFVIKSRLIRLLPNSIGPVPPANFTDEDPAPTIINLSVDCCR